MQQTIKYTLLFFLLSLFIFSCEDETEDYRELLIKHEWECRDTIVGTANQPMTFTLHLLRFSGNTFTYTNYNTGRAMKEDDATKTVKGTYSYKYPKITFEKDGFNTYGFLNEREMTLTINSGNPLERILVFQKKRP